MPLFDITQILNIIRCSFVVFTMTAVCGIGIVKVIAIHFIDWKLKGRVKIHKGNWVFFFSFSFAHILIHESWSMKVVSENKKKQSEAIYFNVLTPWQFDNFKTLTFRSLYIWTFWQFDSSMLDFLDKLVFRHIDSLSVWHLGSLTAQ